MARIGKVMTSNRSTSWAVQGTAVFIAAGALLEGLHLHPLAMPIIGAGLVAFGMLAAACVYLWAGKQGRDPGQYMLYPALTVFLGFAASIISDSDSVMRALNLL